MNYSLAGWLNHLVLLIILGPYILNSLNRKYLKTKNKSFLNLVKILRKIHKPLGLVLIVLGASHGYMALGGFRLHTGTLFYISILITGSLGGAFHRLKKKILFVWHRRMALITALLFLLHFFFPSALYYLLG